MCKLHFLFLVIICFIQNCTDIKSEPPKLSEKTSLSKNILALEDSINAAMKRTGVPGAAVTVVKDTNVIYLKGFGVCEQGTQDSIDTESVFRIGSLSKGFAAVLTGIMVEEGLLNWDDKVKYHLKNFALKDTAQAGRLKIWHLLSHTSGLPRHAYTNLIEAGLPLEKIIPKLAGIKLISKEGEIYAYQNVAFAVIEKIIESKTDSSFAWLLKNKIFKPAGMKNASCSYKTLMETNDLAKPHAYSSRRQEYVTITNSKKYYNTISAGGVNVSISDMSKWLQLLLGNRPDIISQKTLNHIFKPVVKVNTIRYSRRWGVKRSYYALGWRIMHYRDRTIVFHGGYVNAYRSAIAVDRKNKIGICVLFNAPNAFEGNIIPEFFNSLSNADSNFYATAHN